MLIWDNEILRTPGGIYSAREVARPCHTTTAAVSCVKYVWFSFMVVIITLKSPRLRTACAWPSGRWRSRGAKRFSSRFRAVTDIGYDVRASSSE